jgi:hypothetical protein
MSGEESKLTFFITEKENEQQDEQQEQQQDEQQQQNKQQDQSVEFFFKLQQITCDTCSETITDNKYIDCSKCSYKTCSKCVRQELDKIYDHNYKNCSSCGLQWRVQDILSKQIISDEEYNKFLDTIVDKLEPLRLSEIRNNDNRIRNTNEYKHAQLLLNEMREKDIKTIHNNYYK